jgi:hypothetical protein
MIPINSIVVPANFVSVCNDWHGGQACMLYAVSSCKGRFTTGILRPRRCDTPEKWYLAIWRDLSSDADYTLAQAQRSGYDDLDELGEFVDWINYQVARLERSYGLADWEGCDD